jgi:hypothetical protein
VKSYVHAGNRYIMQATLPYSLYGYGRGVSVICYLLSVMYMHICTTILHTDDMHMSQISQMNIRALPLYMFIPGLCNVERIVMVALLYHIRTDKTENGQDTTAPQAPSQ